VLRAQIQGLKETISVMGIQIINSRDSKKVEKALLGQIKELKKTISEMEIREEEQKLEKLIACLESVRL
jgi:septal ring factor EnvC (AmiA/AmiB activator)